MRRVVIALVCVLLFSCAREDFQVDSQHLERFVKASVDSTGYAYSYQERLNLDVDFSNDNLSYSFKLTSPSGDLSWEGNLTGSAELAITDGAIFPPEEWDVIYYADNGNVINKTINLSKHPGPLSYFDKRRTLRTSYNVRIREFNNSNTLIKEADEATNGYVVSSSACYVVINYTDRYLNEIEVRQDFISPSST